MTWGLFILLLVIFIAFTVLLFLQIPYFDNFFETYFLIIIIVIFIVLLFTIDFNNPLSTTIYIRTANNQNPLIYSVPFNDNSNYSNLINVTFLGTYNEATTPINNNPAADTKVFNYDTLDAPVTLLEDKIKFTKLPNQQIQIDIAPNSDISINGFLTMSLICTGSQSIDGSFTQIA